MNIKAKNIKAQNPKEKYMMNMTQFLNTMPIASG
jgi:hypothetical protein